MIMILFAAVRADLEGAYNIERTRLTVGVFSAAAMSCTP